MPVTYRIDGARGVIYTKCAGNVTLDEVVGHFQELARDPECPNRLDVLLDLSEEITLPQSEELRIVSDAIARVRERVEFRACAVVAVRDALFGMLRMFQVFTEDLFCRLEVFRSLPEAEAWLEVHRDPASLRMGDEFPSSVTRRKSSR